MAFRQGRSPGAAFSSSVALLNSRGWLVCFLFAKIFRLTSQDGKISLMPVGYGSIEYGQISDLPCVNGFGGLKTEMIRLRAIPCSALRSRERMLPGPSLVDACLLQARELLS